MPKRHINWSFIALGIAGLIDLWLPHPHVYAADPASIAISIAISAAITAGSIGLEYLIAKKTKVSPVDRGKQDDIRISLPGYGEAIPWSRGQVRGAPVWFWHTPIVDRPVTTPGHSGGKGPPKPPTPTTVDHQYFTSVAGVFHDGPIKDVTRIWFGPDLVWNTTAQLSATKYEAESATLAGGASVAASFIASGSSKVVGIGTGAGGTVTFSVTITDSGDYDIAVVYLDSTSDLQYEVLVDGVSQGFVSCPASGTNLEAISTIGLTLTSGVRLIKFRNTSAVAPDMDRIEVVETVSFSGGSLTDNRVFSNLTDPAIAPPVNQTKPWAIYNVKPTLEDTCPVGYHLNTDTGLCDPDTGGGGGGGGAGKAVSLTANLAKWGSPQIRVYLGTTSQDADSAIVADKGAANTPAWRGLAYLVIENIQLPNGSLPNVTIEWNQGITAVDQIVKDHYALGGLSDSYLDVSALSGLAITGQIRTSAKPIGDSLKDLQTRFQFDMIEVDGIVKAVLRNRTTIDFTVPFAKLRAHLDGSQMPDQDAVITDLDPILLPVEVDINYLDQGLDYHNGVQFDRALDSYRYDVQSFSLALVDNENAIKKLCSTLLHKAEMESRAFQFETGPEFFPVIPGSVGQLVLPNSTHTVRIGDGKYGLPVGLCQFQAVRQAASVYSTTGFGSISGAEAPLGTFPSNTKGIIIDGPILRAEDAGDGTQPVVYLAMCGIGGGAWPGAFLYEENPIGSGNYEFVTGASLPSGIGVTSGTLASVSDPSVWDRTSALTFSLCYDPGLSSASEQDLLANPSLNLIWVGLNGVGEYLQFKTATPLTPSSPYVGKYSVSTFLRARFGTEDQVFTHTSADDLVWIDSTIKPRRVSLADIGR